MVFSRSARLRPALGFVLLVLAGCSGSGSGQELTARRIAITPATLDSLPVLTTTPGEILCPGGTADSLCPRLTALANWLAPDVFAYWEFNRPIRLVRDGVPTTFVSTDPARGYIATIGVGPGPTPGGVIVIDPIDGAAIQFERDGRPVQRVELPPSSGLAFWNYSGPVAYQQTMVPAAANNTVDLVIRTAPLPGADAPKEIFRVNLPWLQMQDQQTTVPPPLFPNVVVYGFDGAGNAIWSGGAQFVVRQTSPSGTVRWSLEGDFTGPMVDSIDMAWKIEQIRQPTLAEPVPEWQIEAMRSISHRTRHPAITALHVTPDGWTLIAGASLPQHASLPYYRLSPDGMLRDRFELPKERQVVLFAGDSVLLFQRAVDLAATGILAWERLIPVP